MIRAIIFDMDGVIFDSEHLHIDIEKEVCKKHGISCKNSDWKHLIGRKTIDIFNYMIKRYKKKNVTSPQLSKEKINLYYNEGVSKMKFFPGFLQLIKFLKKNYKLALVTSTSRKIQRKVFKEYDLNKYFDIVINGDLVKKGKPDPEPYALAIKKLGFKPNECVVIEDADNGVLSAKRAGAKVIAITNTLPKSRLKKADFIVNNLFEIKEIVKNSLV